MTEKETKQQVTDNEANLNINSEELPENASPVSDDPEVASVIEKLKAELADSRDKYLRTVAEFENFKRRNARERVELIQTAGKEVITQMLEVLDDSERAQKQMETSEDLKEITGGISLVFNKLRSVLQAKGLKPMDSINKEFDPDLHEAISEIPTNDPALKGKVVDEVVKGYYLNDKIIRHAKVVVGK